MKKKYITIDLLLFADSIRKVLSFDNVNDDLETVHVWERRDWDGAETSKNKIFLPQQN